MEKPILVTGATGYIGSRCAAALSDKGRNIRWGTRRLPLEMGDKKWVAYGDLADNNNLDAAVAGCGTVIHLAGHAHVAETPAAIASAQSVNIVATEHLAQACVRQRVERLIFMSSALVLAGSKDQAGIISDNSPLSPLTAYAHSKATAEVRLREIGDATGLGWVVLRPPMVYGPGSPGNFRRLLNAVDAGIPLPLGSANAAKSFVYIDNLISAISVLIANPQARNSAFLVSDHEVTSTAGLIRLIAAALGRPPRLLPLPHAACRAFSQLVGRKHDIERLFEPLQLNATALRDTLGWRPHVALETGVRQTVEAWRASQ